MTFLVIIGVLTAVIGAGLFAVHASRKQWQRARDGVFLLVVGALVFSYAAFIGGWWYEQGVEVTGKTGTLAKEDTVASSATSSTASSSSAQDSASNSGEAVPVEEPITKESQLFPRIAAAQKKQEEKPQPGSIIPVYRQVDPGDAARFIGKGVRVTDNSNITHEAILKELRGPLIIFEKKYHSQGSVIFELKKWEIKKLEVIAWRKAK